MKNLIAMTVIAVALAGCSQTESEPPISATLPTAQASPTASPTVAVERTPTPTPPATKAPGTQPATVKPTATTPGTTSFCKYLRRTAGAQQQVEDPEQFVALVDGALAVAPGAIQEDLALYAESVRKLADAVTGGPKQAARADAWLTDNEQAVAQAEANINAYSESTCGQPFIAGEPG